MVHQPSRNTPTLVIMDRRNEETVGLTSQNLYIDEACSQSTSQLSASEPLLEQDNHSTNPIFHRPKWRALLSLKNPSRSQQTVSRPGNDVIGEKPTLKKRKKPRLCLKIGLGILVLLYVLEMTPP